MRFYLPLFLLILVSCHQPQKFDPISQVADGTESSTPVGAGTVYPINTGKQICNPAISGDTVHFPGSMLWLGFSGDLVVKDAPAGFSTTGVRQHDRLTISRKDNSVAWFLPMDSVPAVTCEFQDPDWSAHADWIVSMGANAEQGDCENNSYIYSGWVIRPFDNARFRFDREHLDFISTPHAWFAPDMPGPTSGRIVDSTAYDVNGLATAASVQEYFGTNQVKFSWSKEENGYTIHYIDYSEALPVDRALQKPAGREKWKAESGMISPDGHWIAYNLYERLDEYASYVQELKLGSQPVLIAEGAMDPRWWVNPADPSRLSLVYMVLPVATSYITKENLQDASLLTSGAAGATWMQEVRLSAGLPLALAVEFVGSARKLVNLPFRAGLSPDGRYLATGTNDGYMMELN